MRGGAVGSAAATAGALLIFAVLVAVLVDVCAAALEHALVAARAFASARLDTFAAGLTLALAPLVAAAAALVIALLSGILARKQVACTRVKLREPVKVNAAPLAARFGGQALNHGSVQGVSTVGPELDPMYIYSWVCAFLIFVRVPHNQLG